MVRPRDEDALRRAVRAFGLTGEVVVLAGGTRPVYRVGATVLKHIHDTSRANHRSRELAQWIAGLYHALPDARFRIPRPRHTQAGD